LAATHSRSAARLGSEPECEFPTRVCFVEQVNGGPHRGDRSEKVAEQLMSRDHATGDFPVFDQSAFATFGTLQEYLPDYWGQMRALALALITQAHKHALARRSSEINQGNGRVCPPSTRPDVATPPPPVAA
jgi:hypothetical protein